MPAWRPSSHRSAPGATCPSRRGWHRCRRTGTSGRRPPSSMPRPNTPPGVVPSPDRRSASGARRCARHGPACPSWRTASRCRRGRGGRRRRTSRTTSRPRPGAPRPARPPAARSGRRSARGAAPAAEPQMPSAPPVCGPTTPSTNSPRARWKATVARYVIVPKAPSTGPASNPAALSAVCRQRTASPLAPDPQRRRDPT